MSKTIILFATNSLLVLFAQVQNAAKTPICLNAYFVILFTIADVISTWSSKQLIHLNQWWTLAR